MKPAGFHNFILPKISDSIQNINETMSMVCQAPDIKHVLDLHVKNPQIY